jgi:hypothetical protein
MWGVVPSFPFAVSVAASQKKSNFGAPKMENTLFVGQKKSASVAFLTTPRATRVSDMASFRQIIQ